MRIKIVIFIFIVFLAGCSSTGELERGGLAPSVDAKFEPKGHIEEPLSSLEIFGNEIAPIPNISSFQAINLKPDAENGALLYSVSAVNVPVSEILYILAVDSGKGLSLHSDVVGNVTINAINQPLKSILKSLVEQVSATYSLSNFKIAIRPNLPYWETYRVNYVNLKKKSRDSIVLNMSIGGDSGGEGSGSEVEMTSEHDFWGTLENNLSAMSAISVSGGSAEDEATASSSVAINRESGLVSVYTTADRHRLIRSYLAEVTERSSKQVLIEATVVEVELSDEYQAGIDWSSVKNNLTISQSVTGVNLLGAPTLGAPNLMAPNLGVPNFNINVLDNFNIRMLQRFGETKVLSSPRIMAVSNQTAILKVVRNEVYFTTEVSVESGIDGVAPVTTFETTLHTVPVGFMMSLTPFVTDNDEVSINVRPTLSRIVGHVLDPNPTLKQAGVESRIPIIQEREMSTVLRLRNRQTAVIGGLIQDSQSNDRVGVPGLSSLPVIGDLFSFREDNVKKTELIIFIRPIIIDNPDVSHGDLKSLRPFLRTEK